MLTYLHDIRNKLTLISGHTALLAKKYGEEDVGPIRINLVRINEIINDAYRYMQDQLRESKLVLSGDEFLKQMDLITDAVGLLYPIEITNEVRDYYTRTEFHVDFDIGLVFQVIENALDNSIKARASKLIIRVFESGNQCIYEIVDNGVEKNTAEKLTLEQISIIPHGIGKEIMIENMQAIHGKVEWIRRIDHSGMIVRLYFPKKI